MRRIFVSVFSCKQLVSWCNYLLDWFTRSLYNFTQWLFYSMMTVRISTARSLHFAIFWELFIRNMRERTRGSDHWYGAMEHIHHIEELVDAQYINTQQLFIWYIVEAGIPTAEVATRVGSSVQSVWTVRRPADLKYSWMVDRMSRLEPQYLNILKPTPTRPIFQHNR